MDPLTQGVVGSIGATQAAKKTHIVIASMLGFLSGLTPDLDVLIRSDADPLFALEFHRQFTHSLFFIPVGGVICALFFYWVFARKKLSFKYTYLFCTLGYATHALLDACTTYGTLLFWPFSLERFAWNNISIIDPLFTLPILVLIACNIKFKRRLLSVSALVWALMYLSLGLIQRERAEAAGWVLAQNRGLELTSLEVKPSFANIFVWKIVSSTKDAYYVDAVKVGVSKTLFFEGERVEKLNVVRDFPWLDQDSQQSIDIERFRWFSNGYLAVSSNDANMIVDMRYSMLPNEVSALWGIRLDPSASKGEHVEYIEMTDDRDPAVFAKLWNMIVQ